MAEITSLTTLAKTSTTATDYVLVANSSTKAAKKFPIQSLFPVLNTISEDAEDIWVSLTNKNQLNLKGIKSADATLLTVTTASDNIVLTVLESGIDLDACSNTTSGFISAIDFAGTVTGQCPVIKGGTGLAAITKGSLLYASAANVVAASAAMSTHGQLLIGNGTSGVPAVATLTAGANMTITNGAGAITLAASLSSLAANLDTGAYNIDLNANYLSDDGSDRGIHIKTGKAVINDSGSSLTSGNLTGQLNLQGSTSTAVTIGNSGAYQASYSILTTPSASGTVGAALHIKAATAGGGNMAGGALNLYAGTATGAGAGGSAALIAGDADSGLAGSALLKTYTAGGTLTTALTADSYQDVTVNAGSLVITGASEGIVHTNSGIITQATNHSTGVTLNATSGVITLAAVALAATTNAEFVFTNSSLQADSVILLTMQDENTTNNVQLACALHTAAAGSCRITLANPHSSGASSATASKIHFLIINNS